MTPRTQLNIDSALQADKDLTRLAPEVTVGALIKDFLGFQPFPPDALHHLKACHSVVQETDRDVIILHSSGTTGKTSWNAHIRVIIERFGLGLPKPIHLAHRYLLGYAACHASPEFTDESCTGVNVSTLPLFHVSLHQSLFVDELTLPRDLGS